MFKVDNLPRAPRIFHQKPIVNSAFTEVVSDVTEPKTIAIFGGHGKAQSSVASLFYSPVLGPIQSRHPNFKFIAVDTVVGTAAGPAQIAEQREVLQRNGFSYDQSLHPSDFYRRLEGGELSVDGVVLAIPVRHHLPEMKRLLEALPKTGKEPRILLEKPLGLTHEVDQIRDLFGHHPDGILAADFSNGTDSLNFALANGLRDKIGNLEGIVGRFVEDEQFQVLPVLIQALKDRSILRESINGGGSGIDMAVHSLVTQDRFLEEAFGLTLDDSKIEDVFLGRIDHPEIHEISDPHLETYWRVKA